MESERHASHEVIQTLRNGPNITNLDTPLQMLCAVQRMIILYEYFIGKSSSILCQEFYTLECYINSSFIQ
jgi:hypothetical protein